MRAHELYESGDPYTLLQSATAQLIASLPNDGMEQARIEALLGDGHDPFEAHGLSEQEVTECIAEWCEGKIDEVYYEIGSLARNGAIPAWRAVTADEGWKPSDWDHPGIFWSWDKDAAEAHWSGGQSHTYLMSAEIPIQDIDWVNTLVMNANPSYMQEREIRVFKGTNIEVKDYVEIR